MIAAKNLDVELGLSLKACAPALATLLGTTPDAIYERQRALVRAGLLEESGARGPGGGVRATTKSIATLLIAFLGANELRDIDTHVRKVLSLQVSSRSWDQGSSASTFENGTTLLDALTWAIKPYGDAGARGLDTLRVWRTAPAAHISAVAWSAHFGEQANTSYTKPFLVSAQLWLPAAMQSVLAMYIATERLRPPVAPEGGN